MPRIPEESRLLERKGGEGGRERRTFFSPLPSKGETINAGPVPLGPCPLTGQKMAPAYRWWEEGGWPRDEVGGMEGGRENEHERERERVSANAVICTCLCT